MTITIWCLCIPDVEDLVVTYVNPCTRTCDVVQDEELVISVK